MKKLLILLFVFLFGLQPAYSQSPDKLTLFKQKVLPRFSTYFSLAELTEKGQLTLQASEPYFTLASENKKAVISDIANSWKDSLVIVRFDTRRELWGWNARTSETKLLDEFDLAIPLPAAGAVSSTPKMTMHPWFFYLGGQFAGDSQKNIGISLNTRLGFFLLLNRWDFATTLSIGSSGNIEVAGTPYANIGLMSRVHFPIKKTGFSPNIGVDMTLASVGEAEPTYVPSLVVGFSWFVGIGRIDVGVKIGDLTSGMGGYTMFPGMKNAK
ncbi:MAG: hypothetical protein Q7U54_09985 [Bacteroidales bacterium]|nr:hypothetical protein [Bacteroidales bacterium]